MPPTTLKRSAPCRTSRAVGSPDAALATAEPLGIAAPVRCVRAAIHERGVILLHTEDGRIFTSNHVGARIWQSIERQEPMDVVAARLSREYGVPLNTVRAHTGRFIAELERQHLVELRASR